jgi:hypothetical protein
MFQCAGAIGLALALAGCTHTLVLNDVPDAGAADAVAPSDTLAVSDATCNPGTITLPVKPQPAQLLILLDRSSNMQKAFDGTTREAAVQDALVSEMDAFRGKIKFGFEQFPVDPAVSQCPQNSCCADQVNIIDPGLTNYTSLQNSIQCKDPLNNTCSVASADSPSDAALAWARDYYSAEKFNTDVLNVLLVTSSEPSCAGMSQCHDALSAANDLGNANVSIFVLSVDYQPEPWSSCLSRIARAASSHDSTSLFTANSSSGIITTLYTIFAQVARAACTLNASFPPGPSAHLQVSIGSESVSQATDWRNNSSGWSAIPDKSIITLYGSDCDNYLGSMDNLVVNYTLSDACNPGRP